MERTKKDRIGEHIAKKTDRIEKAHGTGIAP